MIGDEVHPSQVHGLVAAVEADVPLFGLARVSGRPDDQPLDVVEDPLVFGVRIGHAEDSLVARGVPKKGLRYVTRLMLCGDWNG